MGTLKSGSQLSPGQSVTSDNGHYNLAFQTDGNLVLYVSYRGTTALWDTATNGKLVKVLAMQTDGNLVLYDAQQHALWNSGTVGNPGAFLAVQDDGNVVIYVGTKPIWATNTAGSDPLEGVSTTQNLPALLGENNAGAAVVGDPSTAGRGVVGNSATGIGVLGQSDAGFAVFGNSRAGTGVGGNSTFGDAVHGNSGSPNAAGVSGFNLKTDAPSGPGVLGYSEW